MDRREFLGRAARTAVALGFGAGAGSALGARVTHAMDEKLNRESQLKKALILGMLPDKLSLEDRFKLARDCGFDGIEAPSIGGDDDRKALREASDKTGMPIHSIMFGGWHAPLSSGDPAVAEKGLSDLRAGLQCAMELGADALLLVPAVVNAETRYKDAYERSQKHIRSLIPLAEKLNVVIAVENVWNNFLLSPLEFARYVDEFDSPYVQAYFDVGNVVAFGWPEDWIRTLGTRIRKIHLKDFKRGPRQFVNLRDGDVNWPEVRKALDEVGYKGFMTAELKGGDEAYLRDLSGRIDKIIAGE